MASASHEPEDRSFELDALPDPWRIFDWSAGGKEASVGLIEHAAGHVFGLAVLWYYQLTYKEKRPGVDGPRWD